MILSSFGVSLKATLTETTPKLSGSTEQISATSHSGEQFATSNSPSETRSYGLTASTLRPMSLESEQTSDTSFRTTTGSSGTLSTLHISIMSHISIVSTQFSSNTESVGIKHQTIEVPSTSTFGSNDVNSAATISMASYKSESSVPQPGSIASTVVRLSSSISHVSSAGASGTGSSSEVKTLTSYPRSIVEPTETQTHLVSPLFTP